SGIGNIDPLHNPGLIERFWQDSTFGTVASDGGQVYLIDDLDISAAPTNVINGQVILGNPPRGGRIIIGNSGVETGKSFNKLAAYDLQTQGKLKWTVGGQSGEDEPQLAGAYFLGPPLPLEGKLYVLAEMKSSEIKLCVLDAKTGKLDWAQQV